MEEEDYPPKEKNRTMSSLERYQQLYQWEIACNRKMLAMLQSVPEANHHDLRYQQAVNIATHLVACRENWLSFMKGGEQAVSKWFEEASELSALPARIATVEAQWADYLAHLTEEALQSEFKESWGDGGYSLIVTEVQILQLVIHAPYHRGQVSLLVDQLGGTTVDTDFVMWVYPE